MRLLLVRRPNGALAAWPLPPSSSVAEVVEAIYAVAPSPEWHAQTEWCVVKAPSARLAEWPEPAGAP